MSDFSRRTLVRGAAWSVPVIAVAGPVPAFAVSKRCRPIAQCKNPGNPNDKSYAILTNCGPSNNNITAVTIDGKPATYDPVTATWLVPDFKDSRNFRDVVISFDDGPDEEYTVEFKPCDEPA